jgi:hypothetical protein
MVRIALLILTILLALPSFAEGFKVCVINSYRVPPARALEGKVRELLLKEGYSLGNSCSVKIVLGTPALIKELKEGRYQKLIFTFVLFPEELPLPKKRVYGVRIFPLPERTVRAFMEKYGKGCVKVAVPVSEGMVKIAKKYLPKRYFDLLVFRKSPVEVFSSLKEYRVVYIFPDPKLLKVVNLLNLISYGRENGILFITGLGDLKKYGVDFVQEVSYERLARLLVDLVDREPEERILPCPVKEEW